MRTIRALTIAAAVVAAVPTLSAAQSGRQFNDAWFWGIKGGGLTIADSGQQYKQAPMAGIEWLITRKHGGLYVSAGQAFLTSQAFIFRDPAQADSGERVVDLKNMRRLDVALMGFPGEHLHFHPYAGIGFALSQVADAQAEAPFGNSDQFFYAQQTIQDNKVAFSPLLMIGAQYQLRRLSIFGQGSASLAQQNFLLYHGRPYNFTYEAGLRYNVGSSIEKN
jgi:opacity protein-like surface antigen